MENSTNTFHPLIVDAHEDLAWNMTTFQRDYTLSAEEIRQQELNGFAPTVNGDTLLGWQDYQRGRIAVVFGASFVLPSRFKKADWETQSYATPQQAHTLYRKQIDSYHRLADQSPEKFRLVRTRNDLEEILRDWDNPLKPNHPVGLVLLMEGAEGIQQPGETELWWELGVRIIGPAWAGTRFCGGTNEPGSLTKDGYELLASMADHGFILDITHMDAHAALQALESYPQAMIASHSNAQRLLKGIENNRHLPDEVIHGLIEREGIIGVVLFNGFLRAGWKRGDNRQLVTLQQVVAQIDYICQMAGNAQHVGIGTDFDGGFGLQSAPADVDTIADLQKLTPLLEQKGYSTIDIANILGGNWLRLLRQRLPETT